MSEKPNPRNGSDTWDPIFSPDRLPKPGPDRPWLEGPKPPPNSDPP